MKRPISVVVWIVVALVGAGALAGIAFHRGEPLNGTWVVVAAACCYLVAYRFYSALLAARLLTLDVTRASPSGGQDDGRDFVSANTWILFGHHFAGSPGTALLVGPT